MQLRRGVVVLALVGLVAGCGGSSGGGSAAKSSPSPTVDQGAAAKAEITTSWQTFFTGSSGSVDAHLAALEDGEKFRPELTAFAKDPANAALVAKVTDVQVNGDTATVTYDLLGKGGVVLLGGSTGEAVKSAGHWVVSKKTYCQLVMLQDPTAKHPGCA